MGSAIWRANYSLEELLTHQSFEFAFFQAVRLIVALRPNHPPVGVWSKPEQEAIRFRSRQSISFPASELHSIEKDQNGKFHVNVNFLGLTGFKGVLPLHYTELALEDSKSDSHSLADFLDLFNHRFISLFYRAWEKHHFAIAYERAQRPGSEQDPFTSYLFSLIGLGTNNLRRRLPINDVALLPYAGLIAQKPHSMSALEGILRDYFGVPVSVRGFQGRWHQLRQEDLSYLRSEGTYNRLGGGAVAGDAVWVQQARFTVSVGPLTLERFRDFLPNGGDFHQAVALIRFFTERALDFDIQPILKAEEVPLCQFGCDAKKSPRLGWSGWLKAAELQGDVDDAVFSAPDFVQASGKIVVN
jgi:type VI secretion system protein ImpH